MDARAPPSWHAEAEASSGGSKLPPPTGAELTTPPYPALLAELRSELAHPSGGGRGLRDLLPLSAWEGRSGAWGAPQSLTSPECACSVLKLRRH